jgi:hypothetical protein
LTLVFDLTIVINRFGQLTHSKTVVGTTIAKIN